MCRGVFLIMLEQSKMDWLSSYLFLVSHILSFTLRIIFLLMRSFLLVFLHPHPHLHPRLPTHAPALLPASPAASIVLLPPFPLPYHNLITVWAKSDVYSSVSSFGPLRFGGNWAGMLLGWFGLGLGLEWVSLVRSGVLPVSAATCPHPRRRRQERHRHRSLRARLDSRRLQGMDTKLQGIDTSVPVSAPGGCRGSKSKRRRRLQTKPAPARGRSAATPAATATRLLADLLGMEILLPFSHGSILHPLPI